MLGEAVIVVNPPGKHDEAASGLHKASERRFARSEVQCVNEGALMNDEEKWKCLFSYEASTRHLGTRSILKRMGEG